MTSSLIQGARFIHALRDFLRQPMTADEAYQRLRHQLKNRTTSFLNILRRGIFDNPTSPYLPLLKRAGIGYRPIEDWTAQHGVEGTLNQLYEAGVYITIDEFKGRKPIRGSEVDLATPHQDFTNPLMHGHYEARTGGSTSQTGTRFTIDLDLHVHETAYDLLFLEAFDLFGRPAAVWRPGPPGSAGLNLSLRRSKLGQPFERWFSQTEINLNSTDWQYRLFLWSTLYASRLYRRPIPQPDYVPLAQAVQVAQWLAKKKARGTPAVLDTMVGSGIRVCLAAREAGLDISGTLFRFGSEPYTEARARIVAEAGCTAICHYFMSELARVGAACAAPTAIDDVHILLDKLAVIQHARAISGGESVGALYLTTLHPGTPKLMLNVEIGDCGVLTKRECGCPLGQLGFNLHLHSIRSFEKLTSEGMNFLGSELMTLIEDVLPAKFGGNPTDYQLVEFEEDGLAKVGLIISPRIGAVAESKVLESVFQTLSSFGGGQRMMADYWLQAGTLTIIRREPYTTYSAKIPYLYSLRK